MVLTVIADVRVKAQSSKVRVRRARVLIVHFGPMSKMWRRGDTVARGLRGVHLLGPVRGRRAFAPSACCGW